MKSFLKYFFCSLLFFLLCITTAEAKRILVHSPKDFQNVKGVKYVICEDVDLQGTYVKLALNSKLTFKKGSLINGSVEGNNTKVIAKSGENIFKNCRIYGTWNVNFASSDMFDSDMTTMNLLQNLSTISPYVKLLANRDYLIDTNNETVTLESLEGVGHQKPVIRFHTTDPDLNGIIIKGENVRLKNLSIIDDYDVKNDVIYGKNNELIGSTIGLYPKDMFVNSLSIENCDFSGGTSSSYVASSKVKRCLISGCSFSGYIGDHAVYCSVNTQSFMIENCNLDNISHCNGVFKVRSSGNLSKFQLRNVIVHNLHGYLVYLSLKETPSLVVLFDNVSVTKDPMNESVFHGFCITDETKAMSGLGVNAGRLIFKNCTFEYGYKGNSIVYPGSETAAVIRNITYDHVIANESNFGGGISDSIIVYNSSFTSCIGNTGIAIKTKNLYIDNSHLSSNNHCNSLFLMNYGNDRVKSVRLRGTTIDINSTYLAHINDGDNIVFVIDNCKISSLTRNLFSAPVDCDLHFNVNNSDIKANKSYKEITITRP